MKINKNKPKLIAFICVLFLYSLTLSGLQAQVDFDGTYVEDFDTLPFNTNNSDPFTFINNDTLSGWYSNVSGSARSSSGQQSQHGNGIYSWGSIGSTERALGTFLADGFIETAYFGVQLENSSGGTISELSITYTIEQWRRNVNATTWTGDYLKTGLSGDQLTANGYTNIPEATVTATVIGSAGGLNGTLPQYHQEFTITISNLQWGNGEYLWVRWANDQGETSSGLGLNNLTVTAIPEPNASGVTLCVGILTAAWLFSSRIIKRKQG